MTKGCWSHKVSLQIYFSVKKKYCLMWPSICSWWLDVIEYWINKWKIIFGLITVIIFKLSFLVLTTKNPVSFVKMQVLIIQNTVCICAWKLHWKASKVFKGFKLHGFKFRDVIFCIHFLLNHYTFLWLYFQFHFCP